MEPSRSARGFELEPFRKYLLVLAEAGLDPLLRRLVDPSDVVQQTLLEAHQGLEGFTGESFPQRAAWLRQILARNLADCARDHRRARRDVARERSLDEVLAQSSQRLGACFAADESSPSEKAMRGEEILRVAEAVASLPDLSRQVFLLRHCQGWSLDAIARHFGKTGPAVAGLLRRALEKLREELGPAGKGPSLSG